jgi:hypothetical protein
MGGAFKEIKSSVDPMRSFQKILEIMNVLMLPLTYIMTILAYVILNELMPYIGDLIIAMKDVAKAIDKATEATNDYIDSLGGLGPAIEYWNNLIQDSVIAFCIEAFSVVNAFNDMTSGVGNLIRIVQDFLDLIDDHSGGGGGGGGGSPPPGYHIPGTPIEYPTLPPIGNPVVASASNTVNINLAGAVIDDRDKLIRDISEQVIMRLG